ncbi:MAG: outer membrane beta-barrel protein, partial [Geminicoccaceae bacterium]
YSLVAFEDPDREDRDRATGRAGLPWAPGNGPTLDLDASRTLSVSVEDDEDSRTRTSASATLAHRLNLGSRSVLSSSLAFSIARISDLDRTDRDLITGLTYAYRLTDHAFLSASYRFSRRFSNDDDADFYRNLLSAGLTVSY